MDNISGKIGELKKEESDEIHKYLLEKRPLRIDRMDNISAKIAELRKEGLEEIREHLSKNGNLISIEDDESWTAIYIDDDGYGTSSDYSSIYIETDNRISVKLTDDTWLFEDDLTTNHILVIFDIIQSDHGTYTK